MNRRNLLKALPALVAAPIMLDGIEANAHELQADKRYLVVVKLGTNIQSILPGLRNLGVHGSVIAVHDPENDLKIFEVPDEG